MFLIVHGGAGTRRPSARSLTVLRKSLQEGYALLGSGGSSLDAVVKALTVLEDSGVFNAGAGGNLQLDGVRRLDASVMEGRHRRAGSVVGLEGIRNPILVARLIMELPHVMMTNAGGRRIAEAHGLERLDSPDRGSIKRLERVRRQGKGVACLYRKFFSTVGAVAVDGKGSVSSGASTGGVAAMLPGRVGDTPVIGAGIYAENSSGAVSCTGTGESIIRLSLAKEICMLLKGRGPLAASGLSLGRLARMGGDAGVIVLNREGRFAIVHSTPFMAAGFAGKKGIVVKEAFKRFS